MVDPAVQLTGRASPPRIDDVQFLYGIASPFSVGEYVTADRCGSDDGNLDGLSMERQ